MTSNNKQDPAYVHCSDAVNFDIRPCLLWCMRKGYRRESITEELSKFFAEKRFWHKELQLACKGNMIIEENIYVDFIVNKVEVQAMGNIDLISKKANPHLEFMEVKSYFHIPNTPLPYYRDLLQTLTYAAYLMLKYEAEVYCNVVYLNKGFRFLFKRDWSVFPLTNTYNAKRTIESSFPPILSPIKGKCGSCYGDKEWCAKKTKFEREQWSLLGS